MQNVLKLGQTATLIVMFFGVVVGSNEMQMHIMLKCFFSLLCVPCLSRTAPCKLNLLCGPSFEPCVAMNGRVQGFSNSIYVRAAGDKSLAVISIPQKKHFKHSKK